MLQIFLSSDYFLYFIRIVVLLNVLGIFLTDYSFRVVPFVPNRLSTINAVSLCLQLFANCVFTLEIAMKFCQQEANIKDPYLLANFGGTIATYILYYVDGSQYFSI